jgi:hypothetical protein
MVAFVIAVSFLSLGFAVFLARWVLARETGKTGRSYPCPLFWQP